MSIKQSIKEFFLYRRAICSKGSDVAKKTTLQNHDDIWEMTNGIKFYVPHFPYDSIQKIIVFYNDFFEINILKSLDKYIPKNAVILDIGSNIGNHSVYWAARGAKSIHSFEPMLQTYNNLQKNIEINAMEKIIKPYNLGLGDTKVSGEVAKNLRNNIGATQIKESEVSGPFSLKIDRLDDIDLKEEKIDFVKIDVECFEPKTLAGSLETLKKYRPIVFIEVFKKNRRFVNRFFKELGYKKPKRFPACNFLFLP